jgi:hypothetical protein
MQNLISENKKSEKKQYRQDEKICKKIENKMVTENAKKQTSREQKHKEQIN